LEASWDEEAFPWEAYPTLEEACGGGDGGACPTLEEVGKVAFP